MSLSWIHQYQFIYEYIQSIYIYALISNGNRSLRCSHSSTWSFERFLGSQVTGTGERKGQRPSLVLTITTNDFSSRRWFLISGRKQNVCLGKTWGKQTETESKRLSLIIVCQSSHFSTKEKKPQAFLIRVPVFRSSFTGLYTRFLNQNNMQFADVSWEPDIMWATSLPHT